MSFLEESVHEAHRLFGGFLGALLRSAAIALSRTSREVTAPIQRGTVAYPQDTH